MKEPFKDKMTTFPKRIRKFWLGVAEQIWKRKFESPGRPCQGVDIPAPAKSKR